jgi:hypothetical protein
MSALTEKVNNGPGRRSTFLAEPRLAPVFFGMGAVSLNRPAMIDRRIIGNPPHGPEVTANHRFTGTSARR